MKQGVIRIVVIDLLGRDEAFNTVPFNPPSMNVTSANFGQRVSAQLPRVIQFGMRLTF